MADPLSSMNKLLPSDVDLSHRISRGILLTSLLTEAQINVVSQVAHKNALAKKLILRSGVPGVIALHDAAGKISLAEQLVRQYTYSYDALANRVFYNKKHWRIVSDVNRIIGKAAWSRIAKLRSSSTKNHYAVILSLLRELQTKLRHRVVNPNRGEEKVGQPKWDNSKFFATNCHYTTRLIVHGLRELGIPAIHKETCDFKFFTGYTYHAFPWFPTIKKGFAHGDDLYRRPIVDPAKRLVDMQRIMNRWRRPIKRENDSGRS